MKTTLFTAITTIFITLSSLHGAVLAEYNFDEQETTMSYLDQSGNGRWVKFNRNVTVRTEYPFSAEHPPTNGTPVNPVYPELAGKNKSARTTYNAVTAGGARNYEEINLNVTQTFTMEGWVNLQGIAEVDGTPTGGILWNPRSSVGGTSSFLLGYTSEGIVRGEFNSRSQPGGIRHLLTEFTLPMNTWTHLAYVKDSMDVKLYINGEQVVRLIESGITSRGMPISLTGLTVAQNIYGSFDDFRFSDEALAPNELGYFKPFTPIPPKSTVLIVH